MSPPSWSGSAKDLKLVSHEITQAVWWIPSKDVVQDPTARWLAGEIHLDLGLHPSNACSIFSVEVSNITPSAVCVIHSSGVQSMSLK